MSAEPLPEGIYAGFWRRLGATVVDVVLLICCTQPVVSLKIHSVLVAVPVLLFMSTLHLVYTISLHAQYGQTVGKMVAGIRVLRTDGSFIGWREALWRSSVDLVLWPFFVVSGVLLLLAMPDDQLASTSWRHLQVQIAHAHRGTLIDYIGWVSLGWFYSELVTLLFNEKKRALHDFIAGTVVGLKEKTTEVRATQFWQGPPITAGRVLGTGLRSIGVIAGGIILAGAWAYAFTRTDTGVAVAEWMGFFSDGPVQVAPGVRLIRPHGWNVTDDLAEGFQVHALGHGADASISVWSVPLETLQAVDPAGGFEVLGSAIAAQQKRRMKEALAHTWASGTDIYAGYDKAQSRVVTIQGRTWGEDVLVRRDRRTNQVLIYYYTVHDRRVVVVVDSYPIKSDENAVPRDDVIAPVFGALEFS